MSIPEPVCYWIYPPIWLTPLFCSTNLNIAHHISQKNWLTPSVSWGLSGTARSLSTPVVHSLWMSCLTPFVHRQNKWQFRYWKAEEWGASSTPDIYPNCSKFTQSYFFFVEGVIESENMVLNVLCNPINPKLRLYDLNLRVGTGYRVDLPNLLLLFKYGPFPHTDR
jgi:hypothetical protein